MDFEQRDDNRLFFTNQDKWIADKLAQTLGLLGSNGEHWKEPGGGEKISIDQQWTVYDALVQSVRRTEGDGTNEITPRKEDVLLSAVAAHVLNGPYAVCPEIRQAITNRVSSILPYYKLFVDFNDNPSRTWPEVKRILQDALSKTETKTKKSEVDLPPATTANF